MSSCWLRCSNAHASIVTRGVALDQSTSRQRLVILEVGIGSNCARSKGRVLEGMGVLVGVRQPCVRVEPRVRDHHHSLLDVS